MVFTGEVMHRHVNPRSLNRARWLSDLTAVLGQAERLLGLLEADSGYPVETVRLRQKVQTVRSELELLNRAIPTGKRVIGPPWLDPGSTQADNR